MKAEQLFAVSGRVAVITGGTRGIGLDMAKVLTANGAKVIISSRKEVAVDAAVEELKTLGDATGFAADLGTVEGCEKLAGFVGEQTDKIDILINNAGATWGSTLEDFPEDGWDKIMNVNLKGPFFLTQKLFPFLKQAASKEQPAKVINVASVEGMRAGEMETYSYGASKSALIHLTEHLALKLAPRNITVNAIAPGPFATKMMAGTIEMAGEEAISGMVPLKRLGQPEDLYAVALYLGSNASNYVTGQTIALGGGLGTIA